MSPTAATSYNQLSKQQLGIGWDYLDVGLRAGTPGKLFIFPIQKFLVVVGFTWLTGSVLVNTYKQAYEENINI